MKFTGYINHPSSSIQPLNATALVHAGISVGMEPYNVVRIIIEHLPILTSVRIKTIHLISATYGINQQYSGNTALKLISQSGTYLYFQTPHISADMLAGNFQVRVIYEVSPEDITLLRYIAERTTAKIVNYGCKLVTPSSAQLDYPSFIQNLGTTDQTLVYSDCYGNEGSFILKPGDATYFLVNIVNTGSGSTLYQLYSR